MVVLAVLVAMAVVLEVITKENIMSYLSNEMIAALEKIQLSLVNVGDNINIVEIMGCANCQGDCDSSCAGNCTGGCYRGCTNCIGGCEGDCTGGC